MIEPEHRSAHWQNSRINAIVAIGLIGTLVLLTSVFVGLFETMSFLGFPLSYYLVAQGGFVLLIVLVFWSAARQEKTDRRFGASEEL